MVFIPEEGAFLCSRCAKCIFCPVNGVSSWTVLLPLLKLLFFHYFGCDMDCSFGARTSTFQWNLQILPMKTEVHHQIRHYNFWDSMSRKMFSKKLNHCRELCRLHSVHFEKNSEIVQSDQKSLLWKCLESTPTFCHGLDSISCAWIGSRYCQMVDMLCSLKQSLIIEVMPGQCNVYLALAKHRCTPRCALEYFFWYNDALTFE